MATLRKKIAQALAVKGIKIVILISALLISGAIAQNAVKGRVGKNRADAQETVQATEMYPQFTGSLAFDPKVDELWKRADSIMESIKNNLELLTAEDKLFFEQVNYDYENEMRSEYYSVVGEGCSWYCGGGPDSVSASSYLKSNIATIDYLPRNAHDFSFKTAWVEGVPGYGTGEYLVYYFKPTAPRITTINIANGYVKSKKAYRENSRVKKLKMYIDDKPFAILNLKDTLLEQSFNFEPIGRFNPDVKLEALEKLPGWTMKFEILEVYKGDKYDETAISEINFSGIDVHCFGNGTKILMADNSLKNIESIQKNDVVKSYDFENKKLTDSKVSELISAAHSNLLKLKFIDNEITTTSDHPFWTERNVWAAVNAEKSNGNYLQKTTVECLNIGDRVFVPGKNIFSEIIDMENIAGRQITYTIELSENDNFIANGLSVKTETLKTIPVHLVLYHGRP
jgi:hypothetical protein